MMAAGEGTNSSKSPPSRPWMDIGSGAEEPVNPTVNGSGLISVKVESDNSAVVGEIEGVYNGNSGISGMSSNGGKAKQVWNKPSNGNGGVVEVSPVMGVMGEESSSWPALGELPKTSLKSLSSESLLVEPAPAFPTPQVVGSSTSSSPKKVIPNSVNPSSSSNSVAPMRPRSTKRGGGSLSGLVNGGTSQLHSPQPQDLVGEIPPNTTGKPTLATETSPRDQHKSHGGNEQQHHRGSYRRGNGGPLPRGDGSYHPNHVGKRDQDRGHQEWNPHNRRDTHIQPPRGFSGQLYRPSTPLIPPPMPVRAPFVHHMGYPDVPPHPLIYVPGPPPPDSFRALPMVAPVAPLFFTAADAHLYARIVNQIDYYFSNENLVKDIFLRKNMDDQGWVPIKLIAGFKKVKDLTENIALILDAMRTSVAVEVQGDKVRRRNDWKKWVILPPVQIGNVATPEATGNSITDTLASSLKSVALDEKTSNEGNAESSSGRSSSGEFSRQL